MLPADELQRYKQALLQLREQVNEQIEAVAAWCDPVEPDVSLGRITRTDAMQDQQMALHQRDRLRAQQSRIDTALERVENGAFGVCPACNEPIEKARLETAPDSVLCVACLQVYRTRNPGR